MNIKQAEERGFEIDLVYKEKLFVLDIESRPQANLIDIYAGKIKAPNNYKDEEKIKEYIEEKTKDIRKKMSTDTDYAEIICIGIKELGKEPKLYTPETMVEFFKENPNPKFITFNGKGFDISLLIKVGIKKGLDYPYKHLSDMNIRWRKDYHLDLMEIICNNDYRSLDDLLQIYLGRSKKPIDFETASEEEIIQHNLADLIDTEDMYNKFKQII